MCRLIIAYSASSVTARRISMSDKWCKCFMGVLLGLTFAYKDENSLIAVTWMLVRLYGLFVCCVSTREWI